MQSPSQRCSQPSTQSFSHSLQYDVQPSSGAGRKSSAAAMVMTSFVMAHAANIRRSSSQRVVAPIFRRTLEACIFTVLSEIASSLPISW